MKKILLVACIVILLCGCSAQTFEKLEDTNDVQVFLKPATLLVDLPQEAAIPAMEGASGKLYFCGDYDIMVEVLPTGNLNQTLQQITGFHADELNVIQTKRCGVDCYESAWSAAGEAGDHVGRVLVLDDGIYHYCVSILSSANNSADYAQEWKTVLDSVSLTES